MPKYIVKRPSLIGNRLVNEGEEVEYDGLPADNLEPTDEDGRALAAQYAAEEAARAASTAATGNSFDAEALAATVATAVSEAMAKALPVSKPKA